MIPPGGSGKVVAKVHATNYHGRVSKPVTVTSNDPATPIVHLTLIFTVTSPVEVLPAPRVSLSGAQGEVIATTLVLRRDDGKPLKIKMAPPSRPDITVRATRVKPGKEDPVGSPNAARVGDWRMTLTLTDTSTLRTETTTLKLWTNHPERRELALPAYISVRPLVEVMPRNIQLRRDTNGGPASTQVQFRHSANRPFRLLSARLDGDLPGASARIVSSDASPVQRVEILVQGTDLPAGIHRGRLSVETGLTELPRLEAAVTLSITAATPSATISPPTLAPKPSPRR